MATLEGSVGAANQQLEKTSKLVQRIDDLGQRVTRGFEKWSGVLKAAKGVMGDIQSVWGTIQSVTAAVDNYTLLNMRLEKINDSYDTMAGLQARLTEGANDARISYELLAETLLGLETGNNKMLADNKVEQNIAFVEAYAQALKGAGMTSEKEAERMAQMAEIMGSADTKLNGDQLQALIDDSEVLEEIFGEIGSGSMSKLKFFDTIMENLQLIEERAEAVPQTFGEVWNNFANTALLALGPAIDKFAELTRTDTFQDFMNTLIEGIPQIGEIFFQIVNFMIENSDTLFRGILLLIGIFTVWKFVLGLLAIQTEIATGVQQGFNKAVRANAIFMIITLAIMAIMAIKSLWESSETFRGVIQGIVNSFISLANKFIDFINKFKKNDIEHLELVDYVSGNGAENQAEIDAQEHREIMARQMVEGGNEEAMSSYLSAGGMSGIDFSEASLKDLGDSIKLDTVNNVSVETPPANITINFTGDISNKMDLSNMIKSLTKELQKTVNSSSNVVAKAV